MTELLLLDDFVLVDGTGRSPMPAARVVIEDGIIVSVGDASLPRRGGTVVEGHGRWLLPGLWDTHMHHVSVPEGWSRRRSSRSSNGS